LRSESWFCLKTCVVCGEVFRAHSGISKVCDGCRVKPCPRCGRLVKKWSCGVCSVCYNREHYAANREAYGRRYREYYLKNREKVKARCASRRVAHPDKIKAMSVRYYKDNRDEIRIKGRVALIALRSETFAAYGKMCAFCGEDRQEFLCLDHIDGDGRIDREAHLFGLSLYRLLRRAGYPQGRYRVLCHNCNMKRMLEEKMSATQDNKQNRQTRRLKAEMITAYGGHCVCCGETDPLMLALDHVNGNGQEDRARHGRGRVLYAYLRRQGWPQDGYRLLCHNCNMSVGFFGYCPHGGLG